MTGDVLLKSSTPQTLALAPVQLVGHFFTKHGLLLLFSECECRKLETHRFSRPKKPSPATDIRCWGEVTAPRLPGPTARDPQASCIEPVTQIPFCGGRPAPDNYRQPCLSDSTGTKTTLACATSLLEVIGSWVSSGLYFANVWETHWAFTLMLLVASDWSLRFLGCHTYALVLQVLVTRHHEGKWPMAQLVYIYLTRWIEAVCARQLTTRDRKTIHIAPYICHSWYYTTLVGKQKEMLTFQGLGS